MNVKDFRWTEQMTVQDLVRQYQQVGYQSTELARAAETIVRMKRANAKVFLTFTSNMVTSGLRGFFAQVIQLEVPHAIVTLSLIHISEPTRPY